MILRYNVYSSVKMFKRMSFEIYIAFNHQLLKITNFRIAYGYNISSIILDFSMILFENLKFEI